MTRPHTLTAHPHRSTTVLTGAISLTLAAGWAAHHGITAADYGADTSSRLAAVWSVTFLLLLTQTVMYHCERPRQATPRARRQLDALHVAVLMPVYNEDPGYLRYGLESLLAQTRCPNSVHVVDDGSTTGDYRLLRAWWIEAATAAGIATTWVRQPNSGKRHAQAAGVRACPQADVFVTVDSDSCLDHRAVEEILLPFARRDVQSAAGIVLATNHHRNLLTRITDLWFLVGQLTDRSALSAMGAVLVNSGPLAAYRAAVVRDNLDAYLSETFMGRPVMFSDDSLLTLYALLRGRAVQQPSAVVFTALPERPSHFLRMYLRWMRGSTIRSLWRMRYLPLTGWAYWAQLTRWFQVALSTAVLAWLLIVEPALYGRTPPASFLIVPFLIGWAQALRYLSIIRSDERIRTRLITWLLMPAAVVGSWTVLRFLRWYGMATCARTGWGTRQNGAEVTLTGPADEATLADLPDEDTVRIRIPVAKLLDPDTETTLTVPIPRQRTAAPVPEGTFR
ncbi:putative glycosyl transferase [Streptomyces scabiei 87.22]|uniref:Hyaluronan synthase n=1 Tax=Streptomyces scabiei (strain 87.22) TaxID=680198 RepID=C9Z901_STRSW|nr:MULTISPECIES: glycosyltransferase [Streptomyces]MDX2652159.1 glycosyltransferase [Streptomyces scabiei]MDX2725815.1 glycosyltransferase [Streptomyces scabiei]MDX2863934.1 glycosyltransferase [Streptomyces scabiei]MDX2881858.1 glycosyltransferase [Streptomyces scabiei]MDX2892628.1 glycosyltransferase [Streptomyces scabiei]